MTTSETLVEIIAKYFSLTILVMAIFFVAVLNEYAIGYTILIAGLLSLYMVETLVAKNILLVYIASSLLLAVVVFNGLGWLSNWLTAILGVFSLALPVLVTRFIYKQPDINGFFFNNQAGLPALIWRLVIVIVIAWAGLTLVSFKQ